MCGVRFSIAGVVMLAVCAAAGRRVWYSARQIALAAVVGDSVADGRKPHAVVGGTFSAIGAGGFDYCHHAIVVSSARFDAAGTSS